MKRAGARARESRHRARATHMHAHLRDRRAHFAQEREGPTLAGRRLHARESKGRLETSPWVPRGAKIPNFACAPKRIALEWWPRERAHLDQPADVLDRLLGGGHELYKQRVLVEAPPHDVLHRLEHQLSDDQQTLGLGEAHDVVPCLGWRRRHEHRHVLIGLLLLHAGTQQVALLLVKRGSASSLATTCSAAPLALWRLSCVRAG